MDKTSKYRNNKFTCEFCQNQYIQKSHNKIGTQKFCSKKCRINYLTKTKKEKNCINCNKKYLCSLSQISNSLVCSQYCYDQHRYNQIVGICDWCKLNVKRRNISIRKNMFCSKQCAGNYKTYFTEPKNYHKKKIWFNIKNNIEISCETCKLKNINILTVHHVDHNRHNNDINNLMLLCYNCHFEIHHKETLRANKYITLMENNHAAFESREKQKGNE